MAVPNWPRLHVHGPIPHERLAELAAGFDCLLVPFKHTPFVEAVDPVKLYEYVGFGRPIVCRRWREVERFEPFAHLYETSADLIAVLSAIDAGGGFLATAERRTEFVRKNSWDVRARQICDGLSRLTGCRRGEG
jgi:hypothetical protein